MGTSFADAKQFRDLVNIKSQQNNYHFDKIFSDESEEAASLSVRKFEILKKIDKCLQAILRQGEKIYFLSAGTERSIGESFWGWHLFSINHRAIVLTSQGFCSCRSTVRTSHLNFSRKSGIPSPPRSTAPGWKLQDYFPPAEGFRSAPGSLGGLQFYGQGPEAVEDTVETFFH